MDIARQSRAFGEPAGKRLMTQRCHHFGPTMNVDWGYAPNTASKGRWRGTP
jgi:hypothetical protein